MKQLKHLKEEVRHEWPMHVDFTTKIFPIIWREEFLPGSKSYITQIFYIK